MDDLAFYVRPISALRDVPVLLPKEPVLIPCSYEEVPANRERLYALAGAAFSSASAGTVIALPESLQNDFQHPRRVKCSMAREGGRRRKRSAVVRTAGRSSSKEMQPCSCPFWLSCGTISGSCTLHGDAMLDTSAPDGRDR